jgi:hypothetical protein
MKIQHMRQRLLGVGLLFLLSLAARAQFTPPPDPSVPVFYYALTAVCDPVDAGTDIEIKLIPRGLHVVVNERGDRSASPVQHIFQDLMDQINTSIRNRQRKLQRSGKELLERITPKK